MTTRIGLFSDPHANPEPVAEALQLFEQQGVDLILCAGDIAGYGDRLDETVELITTAGVLSVRGNHEEWALQRDTFPGNSASHDYFASLPDRLELGIEGCRLYMVHAEPPDKTMHGLRPFDQYGEVMPQVLAEWQQRLEGFGPEVLILGHTHQVYAFQLGATWVINPGSSSFNHSCAILTLPQRRLVWFPLSGQPISKVWNWGSNEVPRQGRPH